ncbi:hypothetical protein G7Y89_g8083 [Cudoniella acicularis]|uniref:Zn(2)-C6 fungal-type domain-containing protein n=1 Tax=Cudoniella acicularis TaxID=354080 RepID=A0A8H4W0X8_9HELO|nr:hypothetical protein G7Y89_g8083 [Cudoniella acicularis]
MFGTLHCNTRANDVKFVERPDGSSKPEKHSACDRCRARKVKCRTKDDGCTRCKSLGKTCTFSSIEQKDIRRRRRRSTNNAQQEYSLGFSIQSSASSSSSGSRDTGREEGVSSDKRPPASPAPADGNINNSEQGQQPLAEPTNTADRFADIPSDFDLSFLNKFNQCTGDQDGDMFDLTLSSSPFFSLDDTLNTIPPRTSPEPNQSAAISSSLSSRGETPCYFPATSQSPDMSFIEIGSNPTSTTLHASTIASITLSSQNLSRQPCQCLSAVIFALEKFEASCNSGNRAELDSIVACQKEAIKCCRLMLGCSSCMSKREYIVLLVFMIEKVVAACGRIVVLYRMKDGDNNRPGSVPPLLLSCLPSDCLSRSLNNVGDLDLVTSPSSSSSTSDRAYSGSITSTGTGTGMSSDWQELLLGDYEISSLTEWDHLMRVLIFLQLRAIVEFLADMKNVLGSMVLGEMQMAKLAQVERRVSELAKDIQ